MPDYISPDEQQYLEKFTTTLKTMPVQIIGEDVEIAATFLDKAGFAMATKFLTLPVSVYQRLTTNMLFRYILTELSIHFNGALAPQAFSTPTPLEPPKLERC